LFFIFYTEVELWVAALPVVRVLEGRQLLWDVTLRDGQVVYDYLEAERLSGSSGKLLEEVAPGHRAHKLAGRTT
jgi:hypothetical protein